MPRPVIRARWAFEGSPLVRSEGVASRLWRFGYSEAPSHVRLPSILESAGCQLSKDSSVACVYLITFHLGQVLSVGARFSSFGHEDYGMRRFPSYSQVICVGTVRSIGTGTTFMRFDARREVPRKILHYRAKIEEPGTMRSDYENFSFVRNARLVPRDRDSGRIWCPEDFQVDGSHTVKASTDKLIGSGALNYAERWNAIAYLG